MFKQLEKGIFAFKPFNPGVRTCTEDFFRSVEKDLRRVMANVEIHSRESRK